MANTSMSNKQLPGDAHIAGTAGRRRPEHNKVLKPDFLKLSSEAS